MTQTTQQTNRGKPLDITIQTITFLIFILTLSVSLLTTQVVLRRKDGFPLRRLPAYDVLPTLEGQAIESDRPILLSSGSARVGDESTLVAIAAIEAAYQVAQGTAIGRTAPVFVTSEGTAIPLGYDTLRRAYQAREMPVRSGPGSVRWYPAGARSVALAAMLTVTVNADDAAGAVLVGSFGAELALPLEQMARYKLQVLAGSDQLAGQAVAYAMADGALIGEDLYTAGAYLGEDGGWKANLITQDFLRGLVVLAIILVALAEVFGDQISAFVGPLLGGG